MLIVLLALTNLGQAPEKGQLFFFPAFDSSEKVTEVS